MVKGKRNTLAGTIAGSLRRALSEKKGVTRAHLAFALQIPEDTRAVGHWLSPTVQRPVPAYVIPQLCQELSNYDVLDQLEEASGRKIIVVPTAKQDIRALLKPLEEIHNCLIVVIPTGSHSLYAENDFRAVQELIKEVGTALNSLGATLEDGRVDPHELADTIPKLDSVIDVCVKLKHWLETRCEADQNTGTA